MAITAESAIFNNDLAHNGESGIIVTAGTQSTYNLDLASEGEPEMTLDGSSSFPGILNIFIF